jgi:hypothetical protein
LRRTGILDDDEEEEDDCEVGDVFGLFWFVGMMCLCVGLMDVLLV